MNREQFEFALSHLNSSHWQWFEELAAEFLVSDYPDIRTTACVHGDRGRDGYLMAEEADAHVIFQYSVAADWDAKIRGTAKKIHDNFPTAKWLVYATNRQIGADGDDVKQALRTKWGLNLDILDASWFLERRNGTPGREAAAIDLFDRVGKPILESKGFYETKATALDTVEQKTLLVHLGLHSVDEARGRNLTKFAYEALVRTALLGTSSENRLSRADVYDYVAKFVPEVDRVVRSARVDSALKKMDKVVVRHYQKDDEFILTYEERQRISTQLAEAAIASEALDEELAVTLATLMECADADPPFPGACVLVPLLRRVLEELLLHRGEALIAAAREGGTSALIAEDVRPIALKAARAEGLADPRVPGLLAEVVRVTGESKHDALSAYIRRLANSYTLLAFLNATPDVQKAVRAVYSTGDLWVDTNIVLRVLTDQLREEEALRPLTIVLAAAREAGLGFHITGDVIEEVLRHMDFAYACARTSLADWTREIPFLFASWIGSGRSREDFGTWLLEFRGSDQPEEDLAEYLDEFYGIARHDLDEDADRVDDTVRSAVKEAWIQVHEGRNRPHENDDGNSRAHEKARRDAASYLGILGHRESGRNSFLGWTSWWLTMDHSAYDIHQRVPVEVSRLIGRPPVMNPDFLTNYLAIRPSGGEVAAAASLPVILDMGHADTTPPEFVEEAQAIRDSMQGQREHVIRRTVRNKLDAARCRASIPDLDGQLHPKAQVEPGHE